MNGKDLMEAMSFVDEKYIAQAEALPRRHAHWKPLVAAAACLVVVLTALWRLWPEQSAQMLRQAPEAAVMEAALTENTMAEKTMGTDRSSILTQEDTAVSGAAGMMASPFAEMTVQVLEWTQEGARCQVVDPMSSGYEAGQELTVTLPEATEAYLPSPASLDSTEPPVYRVSFLMTEETGTITAAQWTREDQN